MTEIDGLYFHNISDEQEALLRHRGEFTQRFCEAKGWDRGKLTLQQILTIRQQPEWKTLPAGERKADQ